MKLLFHSFLLLFSFLFIFFWTQTKFVNYTVQFLGLVGACYLIGSFIRRKLNPKSEIFGTTKDILVINTTIFLLITITGNLYSPLFFLVYFLGFGITFIFEPGTIIVYALCSMAIFLPQAIKNGSLESFLRLGSIILITPLAFFFGSDYRDRNEQEAEIITLKENTQQAAREIKKDIEAVLENEAEQMKKRDIETLKNAKEETRLLEEDL